VQYAYVDTRRGGAPTQDPVHGLLCDPPVIGGPGAGGASSLGADAPEVVQAREQRAVAVPAADQFQLPAADRVHRAVAQVFPADKAWAVAHLAAAHPQIALGPLDLQFTRNPGASLSPGRGLTPGSPPSAPSQ